MAADIVLAPDVLVNASLAQGSPPEQVVQRVLGQSNAKSKTTEWILARVESMLSAVPEFKDEAVQPQLATIRNHMEVVQDPEDHGADEWEKALVATAKIAGASQVVTDHPDLLARESSGGIQFVSTETWLGS